MYLISSLSSSLLRASLAAKTLQGRRGISTHVQATNLANSLFVGTKVALGIVLTGPRMDGALVGRNMQQLFSVSRQGIHL